LEPFFLSQKNKHFCFAKATAYGSVRIASLRCTGSKPPKRLLKRDKTLGRCPKQFRLFASQKTESRRDCKNCKTIFATSKPFEKGLDSQTFYCGFAAERWICFSPSESESFPNISLGVKPLFKGACGLQGSALRFYAFIFCIIALSSLFTSPESMIANA
jgi:hypothetical protein